MGGPGALLQHQPARRPGPPHAGCLALQHVNKFQLHPSEPRVLLPLIRAPTRDRNAPSWFDLAAVLANFRGKKGCVPATHRFGSRTFD